MTAPASWCSEAVDTVDEAHGYYVEITVIIHPDNGVAADNDEYQPIHKEENCSAAMIATVLHAGGNRRKSYKVSGGLHGVGASA